MTTPSNSDRYPLKNAWARLQGLFIYHLPGDARIFEALIAIPVISNPYQGTYPVTQAFHAGHPAIDWGMPTGTPIYAAHAGQVVRAGADATGYGYVVCIKDDGRGLYTVYGHLNHQTGIVVRTGEWVQERRHIGYSDNTGNSTGPHLHFELRVPPYGYGNYCVNPAGYLRGWSKPPVVTPPAPPTISRARTLRNSPVIKKNTGKKVGLYSAGTLLTVGGMNGDWTYVPGQPDGATGKRQPDGWVKTANLVKV